MYYSRKPGMFILEREYGDGGIKRKKNSEPLICKLAVRKLNKIMNLRPLLDYATREEIPVYSRSLLKTNYATIDHMIGYRAYESGSCNLYDFFRFNSKLESRLEGLSDEDWVVIAGGKLDVFYGAGPTGLSEVEENLFMVGLDEPVRFLNEFKIKYKKEFKTVIDPRVNVGSEKIIKPSWFYEVTKKKRLIPFRMYR